MANVNFNELITFTRSTGGGRFNAAGQYEWLPANEPRLDYDPVSGECRGILIEEQRTNLLLRSAEFDNASWMKLNATITANAFVAPDGTMTADKLVEDTTTGFHRIFVGSLVGLTNNTARSFSVFVRAAERATIRVQINAYSNNYMRADVDLTTGTVTPFKSGNATITSALAVNVGNGWWRVSLSGTPNIADSGNSVGHEVRLLVGPGDTYQGDGTSGLYIWGAQLEAGASPTSYIPTTTAQVTRAADLCSVDNLSPWYRKDEGTLMVEAIAPKTAQLFARAASLEAPGKNVLSIQRSGSSNNAKGFGSGYSLDAGLNSFPAEIPVKLALSAGGGIASLCVSGGAVVKSSAGSLDAPTKLHVGSANSGASILNGHIRRIRYIPRRISDTELQALTAL